MLLLIGEMKQPTVPLVRQRLLRMSLTKNQTKNGKIASFNAFVAAGNRNGGLGIGAAKHSQAIDAIQKAGRVAVKSMTYFSIYENRTLHHDDFIKFKATRLYARPAAAGLLYQY